MYKKILIATDGSKLAGKAVKPGIAFAKALDAKVTALAVDMIPRTTVAQIRRSDPFRGFRRRQGGGRCVQHRACRERASL